MEQYAQNLMCTDEEKVITYCKNIIKAVEKHMMSLHNLN